MLIGVAFFAAMLTSIVGLGGGVLLIAFMPGILPPAAVVPIHGIVQLASNFSRTFFGRTHLESRLLWPFIVGAGGGAAVGSVLVKAFPPDYFPLLLGVFILLSTWAPRPRLKWRLPSTFVSLGFFQTFLSLFVGAAGPLNMPFLLRQNLGRDRTVVTHGAQMVCLHGFKISTFALLGFNFAPYLSLTVGMIAAVILGSYLGTRWRGRLPEAVFGRLMHLLVTALALRMIWRVVF
jgi:uncharacterized protein